MERLPFCVAIAQPSKAPTATFRPNKLHCATALRYEQRFNVAVSRSRDRVVLACSFAVKTIRGGGDSFGRKRARVF